MLIVTLRGGRNCTMEMLLCIGSILFLTDLTQSHHPVSFAPARLNVSSNPQTIPFCSKMTSMTKVITFDSESSQPKIKSSEISD